MFPFEIFIKIFGHCRVKTLRRVRWVCREWFWEVDPRLPRIRYNKVFVYGPLEDTRNICRLSAVSALNTGEAIASFLRQSYSIELHFTHTVVRLWKGEITTHSIEEQNAHIIPAEYTEAADYFISHPNRLQELLIKIHETPKVTNGYIIIPDSPYIQLLYPKLKSGGGYINPYGSWRPRGLF